MFFQTKSLKTYTVLIKHVYCFFCTIFSPKPTFSRMLNIDIIQCGLKEGLWCTKGKTLKEETVPFCHTGDLETVAWWHTNIMWSVNVNVVYNAFCNRATSTDVKSICFFTINFNFTKAYVFTYTILINSHSIVTCT